VIQRHTRSGMSAPECAPNRSGAALRARAALLFATSDRHPVRFLARLIAEQKAFDEKQAVQQRTAAEFSELVSALKSKGRTEEWSQRKLADKAGFTESSWCRVCNCAVNPVAWLPQLRNALVRLQTK
jgi:hypothetical protein